MLTEMPVMNLYDESGSDQYIMGGYRDKNYLEWAPIKKTPVKTDWKVEKLKKGPL